jgi:hypothetical protein
MFYNYGWPLIKTKEALDRKQSCTQKILKKMLKNIFARVAIKCAQCPGRENAVSIYRYTLRVLSCIILQPAPNSLLGS